MEKFRLIVNKDKKTLYQNSSKYKELNLEKREIALIIQQINHNKSFNSKHCSQLTLIDF
jgi:hypothetical protein